MTCLRRVIIKEKCTAGTCSYVQAYSVHRLAEAQSKLPNDLFVRYISRDPLRITICRYHLNFEVMVEA